MEPATAPLASTLIVTINGTGNDETARQAVERELHAAREKVRQMTEDMRARLAEDEQEPEG